MKLYLRNAWVRVGLLLAVVGWLPLGTITLLVARGDWPDLNPLVPRLLSMFTVWPAVLCVVVGVFQVKRDRALQAGAARALQAGADEPKTAQDITAAARPREHSPAWMEHRITRTVAGLVGFGLVLYGTTAMLQAQGRGAAVAMAIGVVDVYWAFVGRLPLRFWH